MSQWPTIVKQLMAERNMSERQLCIRAGVWRNSLRSFLHGDGRITVGLLDRVLAAFGYQLAAISYAEGERTCRRSDQEFVGAEKSWNRVRDAVAKQYGTETARRATIKTARRLVNADTTANGTKSDKPISPSIADASDAANPRPSSITSSRTRATESSSGPEPIGKPFAPLATTDQSNGARKLPFRGPRHWYDEHRM
jgi:transcriptional regulator with XRE-family HTH domain